MAAGGDAMKILVTGAAGQLGQALRSVLEPRHAVSWTDRDELDVRDLAALRAWVREQRPEAIVHLAARTDVDGCEGQGEIAFEINSLGTRYAALAARESGARLVFLSSDYVFDGAQARPYLEYDDPHPLNVYGWSKVHGERAVRELAGDHFIVRTSGLFACGGCNFPEAILRAAGEGRAIEVVDDQICRPTYAPHLAEAVGMLLESTCFGTYHVASAGATSWCDFARAILSEAGLDPSLVRPIPSGRLGRPARRPAQSVLDTRAFELTFGRVLPSWREGLGEFFASRGAAGKGEAR
ncbi:MAG: dTDP-4-dehydrorhamnose reductase [Candidatus Eisenbacteria bacterium]